MVPKSLVLSGGSTKIPLHIGAIQSLEQHNIKFNRIFGVSAGSIIAACLAIGYDFDKLYKLLFNINFYELMSNTISDKIKNIFNNSLNSGDKLLNFYKSIFKDIIFEDLPIELHVIAHSLDEGKLKDFNPKDTPKVSIAKAIRASSSIPLLFSPVEIDGKWYSDGGMSKNFPIDLVPSTDFYIGHLIRGPKNYDWQSKNFLSFALFIIDQLIEANINNSVNKNGIIVESFYNIPITQFYISIYDKQLMVEVGYKNMENALLCL